LDNLTLAADTDSEVETQRTDVGPKNSTLLNNTSPIFGNTSANMEDDMENDVINRYQQFITEMKAGYNSLNETCSKQQQQIKDQNGIIIEQEKEMEATTETVKNQACIIKGFKEKLKIETENHQTTKNILSSIEIELRDTREELIDSNTEKRRKLNKAKQDQASFLFNLNKN